MQQSFPNPKLDGLHLAVWRKAVWFIAVLSVWAQHHLQMPRCLEKIKLRLFGQISSHHGALTLRPCQEKLGHSIWSFPHLCLSHTDVTSLNS